MHKYAFLQFALLGMAAAISIPAILYLASNAILYPQFLSPDTLVSVLRLIPPCGMLGFLLGLCTYGIYRFSQLFSACRSLPARVAIAGLTAGILGAYPIGVVAHLVSFRAGPWTTISLCGGAVAIIFGGYITLESRRTRRRFRSRVSAPSE